MGHDQPRVLAEPDVQRPQQDLCEQHPDGDVEGALAHAVTQRDGRHGQDRDAARYMKRRWVSWMSTSLPLPKGMNCR